MKTMQPESHEMKTDDNTYFYCYNPKLRKFLGFNCGLRWKKKGFNEDTKSYYWTFEETEELSRLIEEYKKENDLRQIN